MYMRTWVTEKPLHADTANTFMINRKNVVTNEPTEPVFGQRAFLAAQVSIKEQNITATVAQQ